MIVVTQTPPSLYLLFLISVLLAVVEWVLLGHITSVTRHARDSVSRFHYRMAPKLSNFNKNAMFERRALLRAKRVATEDMQGDM